MQPPGRAPVVSQAPAVTIATAKQTPSVRRLCRTWRKRRRPNMGDSRYERSVPASLGLIGRPLVLGIAALALAACDSKPLPTTSSQTPSAGATTGDAGASGALAQG